MKISFLAAAFLSVFAVQAFASEMTMDVLTARNAHSCGSMTPPENHFMPKYYADSAVFATKNEARVYALSLCQSDRSNPLSPFMCRVYACN